MWCRYCDTLFNWDTLEIMKSNSNEIYKQFKKDLKDDIIEYYNNLNINEKELYDYFNNFIDLKNIFKFNKIDNNIINDEKYYNHLKTKILFYITDNKEKDLELNYYNDRFKKYI